MLVRPFSAPVSMESSNGRRFEKSRSKRGWAIGALGFKSLWKLRISWISRIMARSEKYCDVEKMALAPFGHSGEGHIILTWGYQVLIRYVLNRGTGIQYTCPVWQWDAKTFPGRAHLQPGQRGGLFLGLWRGWLVGYVWWESPISSIGNIWQIIRNLIEWWTPLLTKWRCTHSSLKSPATRLEAERTLGRKGTTNLPRKSKSK